MVFPSEPPRGLKLCSNFTWVVHQSGACSCATHHTQYGATYSKPPHAYGSHDLRRQSACNNLCGSHAGRCNAICDRPSPMTCTATCCGLRSVDAVERRKRSYLVAQQSAVPQSTCPSASTAQIAHGSIEPPETQRRAPRHRTYGLEPCHPCVDNLHD